MKLVFREIRRQPVYFRTDFGLARVLFLVIHIRGTRRIVTELNNGKAGHAKASLVFDNLRLELLENYLSHKLSAHYFGHVSLLADYRLVKANLVRKTVLKSADARIHHNSYADSS